MTKIYDVAIIGAGSAGLSAGIYAGRAKLNTVIIEKGNLGGQATTTSEIVNYPGIRHTSGPALMEEMRLQAEDFGVQFVSGDVQNVNFEGDVKRIETENGVIEARSVVIATGASPRKLGFKGEKEFTGRGVAYCATCDGEFFTGMDVFVIGAGYAAAEEAMFLTRFVNKVTIIAREPEFTCAKSIADKVLAHEKIEVRFNSEILEAKGDEMLQAAHFRNNETGEEYEFVAKDGESFGIFVFIGYQPQTDLFKGHVEMDRWGYVVTDEDMRTNVKGVYAAGDLRPKSLRQIVTAVADGAIAAIDVEKYVTAEKERLGIKDEPKAEAPKKEEAPKAAVTSAAPGKSKLLNDGLRTQLSGIFAKMESDVTLVTIVDPSNAKSIELRDLVLDFADLGDKLHATVVTRGENPEMEQFINSDKYPVVALVRADGTYTGVKFHGVPGGHELNSFVLAIYNTAGPGQAMDEATMAKIKAVKGKTNVKVAVSLACHLCPEVVVGAQKLAIYNEDIEAEMIDLANFPELKTKYKLMSVPAIIVNDEKVHFGSKKLDELITIVEDANKVLA